MTDGVSELAPEQLRILLDDTQASLAASLARVEAYRIQNKQLLDELSQLRAFVHGQQHGEQPSTAGLPKPEDGIQRVPSEPCSITVPQAKNAAPVWTSLNSTPLLISELEGDFPVLIVNGGKKVPANLLVTREFVDFSESRARIRQHEFVGITSVKGLPKEDEDGSAPSTSGRGTWQMIWNKDNVAQRLVFEASNQTRESLHRHTEKWLGLEDGGDPTPGVVRGDVGELAPPKHLVPGEFTLTLAGPDPSTILTAEHLRALASAVPPMERMRSWRLSYSTECHGISLSTLYRRIHDKSPAILVVKDAAGYIFGSYTPDSWKINPRFYGSGETFIFQLEPHRVYYPWRSMSDVKNDFFMYATPECIAVGGLGHFAIHIDSELLQGSSGSCGTFGSPCIASKEEYKVMGLEVWQAY